VGTRLYRERWNLGGLRTETYESNAVDPDPDWIPTEMDQWSRSPDFKSGSKNRKALGSFFSPIIELASFALCIPEK
jgi:hypothetical protein